LTYSEERNAYLGRDMLQHKWFSNASVKMIDTEVRSLLHDSYQRAFSLLETNRQVLDYLAEQLIETETIDGNLVRETLKNPPAIN
jgi:cell division protease FtsH